MKIKKSKEYETKTIIWCFILLVILIAIAAYIQEFKTNEVVIYTNYTVRAGDKIDTIAEKYYPDIYLPKARTEIKNANNMIESDIYEGQVLKIKFKETY